MGRLLKGLCAEIGTLPESEARRYSATPATPDVLPPDSSKSSGVATKHDSDGNGRPPLAIRDHLLTLADAEGIDRAHVNALAAGDVAACAGLDGNQLTAFLLMARDTAERRAGRAPAGDTAPMLCKSCGPVWTHPDIAAVLPVVDGWPRALGCPWCFIRKAGGYIPRPSVTCEGCRHFQPATINPEAGMGDCGDGHGMFYARQKHRCGHLKPGEVTP